MRTSLLTLAFCWLLGCCGCFSSSEADQGTAQSKKTAPIELQMVQVSDLTEAINTHKGKIVVVDVWATFCAPCMQEFPHFVELHRKYGSQGVVCISVTVDDAEQRESALKFLERQEATCTNYLVDYAPLQNEWVFAGVPVVRVIAPSGEVARQFTNTDTEQEPFTYREVEAVVQDLLEKAKS